MNTEVILAKIDEEARQSAAEILKEAKQKAVLSKKNSEERIAQDREQVLKQAQTSGQELEEKMLRMAQLEQGKEMLLLKQNIMNKAFEQALLKLQQLPKEELEAFFSNLVLDAAQGTETILLGDQQMGWFEEAFVTQVNKALLAKGKTAELRLGTKLYPGETGVVLKGEGTLVHCTLESILSACRMDLEASVAATLFS